MTMIDLQAPSVPMRVKGSKCHIINDEDVTGAGKDDGK
jgi:hypothetical protein